jgi:hypothetical protein
MGVDSIFASAISRAGTKWNRRHFRGSRANPELPPIPDPATQRLKQLTFQMDLR